MAFEYLVLLFLVNVLADGVEKTSLSPSLLKLDPKKRTDLVDEAFLEQKDVLLDMLENKLKQVRDKKKKKPIDRTESSYVNGIGSEEPIRCDLLPTYIDLKLKANGMVAVGEADFFLKLGNMGKGTLNMDAVGISNVGKSHLELGVNDGNVYIPGINNLFTGKLSSLCNNGKNVGAMEAETAKVDRLGQGLENKTIDTRRKSSDLNNTNTIAITTPNAKTVTTSDTLNNTEAVTVSLDDSTQTSIVNDTPASVDITTETAASPDE